MSARLALSWMPSWMLSCVLTWVLSGCVAAAPPHDPGPCEETARRLGAYDARCGYAWGGPEELILDCERASPRDLDALVEDCWPALETAPCSLTTLLPEACRDQF